jgi:hypothetical protein
MKRLKIGLVRHEARRHIDALVRTPESEGKYSGDDTAGEEKFLSLYRQTVE